MVGLPLDDNGESEAAEAEVTIGDTPLDVSQSMALRVAVQQFLLQLSDPRFEESIKPLGQHYHARLIEIMQLMRQAGLR